MKISKELVKGSTAMLVLSVIEDRPAYGYLIIKEMEELSENVFCLNEGTLYPILHALEQEKYLESFWEESGTGRRRKYYRITDRGRKELSRKKEEWKTFAGAVSKVLHGGAIYG